MIVTLTPNPSLDRTVSLPGALVRGGVNRLSGVVTDPGGKGVNVARVLAASGARVTTVLPAASHDPLLAALDAVALPDLTVAAVTVAGAARVNTAVTEPDGTTTKINEPGSPLGDAERSAIESALLEAVGPAASGTDGPRWAVLSGSLPPGAPTDWYARLEELGQLAGLPAERATALEDGARAGELGPVVEAARVLVERGVTAVMATLGPAGGVLVTAEGAWHAQAPQVAVLSTVGAGDSSVAGYVLASVRGQDAAGRLATAMRYGSAAASLPGTTLPTPADLPGQVPAVTQIA